MDDKDVVQATDLFSEQDYKWRKMELVHTFWLKVEGFVSLRTTVYPVHQP
ncbi:hypothetical protein [Duganella caerulea]